MVALTATATKLTKDIIFNVLLRDSPFEIKESPNKVNVTYIVECMDKDTESSILDGVWKSCKTSCMREDNYLLSYHHAMWSCGDKMASTRKNWYKHSRAYFVL